MTPLQGKNTSKADSSGPPGQTASPDFSQAHKGLSLQILTSSPTLRVPDPLCTADCPFEGAGESTHEDLPLPVGPRIAFKPGFIMPLEEGKSYFQMEDCSHAAHSRGKV